MITKIFGDYSKKEVKRIRPICDKVLSLDKEYSNLSDEQLKAKTNHFKERLEHGESLDDILPEAFAACREASWRVLGIKHYPVQIIGGIVLHQGRIAEMKTGEGKTLVATLPAYLNALTGNGVHIVTVNDYLAKRDSEWMGRVFCFMGLSVGLITHEKEGQERKAAYAADITYGTNNEMGFDYLRDNMVFDKEMRVQRGHNFAIVDEVDSILVDEARTPLIISGIGERSNELYELANQFALSLNCIRIKEVDSKENLEDIVDKKYDYVVDEKQRTATLTESGIEKAEKFFNIENLMDPRNMIILHHINQAIKAIGIMKKDIDYIVKDNQVLIVDEFTGRIMPGRRYNEGLHQAIEAKENMKIESESKTLATITFQNYFRLYKKLSGMTGTGETESAEFNQIYALDVVQIPTNKPVIRKDLPDIVYKTEKAKYKAIINQINDCYRRGQPVLVGTASVEKSEYLSKLLAKKKIRHQVLNAKNHEKEAEIVAQAGKEYAVTIATNMAGRGTDIKLGGNAEYLAKAQLAKLGYTEDVIYEAIGFSETDNEDIIKARADYKTFEEQYSKEIEPEAQRVREKGGLFIIGTERHESRRIDNQLRGRAGRQGDPGTSVFYISLEDDLMQLFGGNKIASIMDSLKTPDDEPIISKTVSNSIENAQKNIEGKNFGIRKNVLQYDDVINIQRKLIYKQRDTVIDSEDIKPIITRMLEDYINNNIDFFCSKLIPQKEWNVEGLYNKFEAWLSIDKPDFCSNFDKEVARKFLLNKAHEIYNAKEQQLGVDENGIPAIRKIEKTVLLRNVDINWMNHIDAVDQLRKGIELRAYGNTDPVIAYRQITSDMFDAMNEEICENTIFQILTAVIKKPKVIKKTQTLEVSSANNKPKVDTAKKFLS